MSIHWHRRDLRATDNRGLAAATDSGPVIPVFIFDPAILEHGAPPRVAGMLEALAALRAWYRERDSDLIIAHGDPSTLLTELAAEYDADHVTFNQGYSGLAAERDRATVAALEDAGRTVEGFHDAICHEPGSILTNKGDHYSVYTYFWKKWRSREKDEPYESPTADDLATVTGEPLPTLEELGFEPPGATTPTVTPAAARERVATFCGGPIEGYADRRDQPAAAATSRLSVHLKWGTIGIRELYAATRVAHERAGDAEVRASIEEFQSQLAWREFYMHVLAYNPEVVNRNFKSYEHDLEWQNDPAELEAWKRGETGYPIVDAGMRQLLEEAWVHNRVRMIVASFLTKDLLIDWREGYDWYRQKLADHDTANDNGGWQWAASTGTDAQPYFRIFNPMKQGADHDPDADYIKTYVPELAACEPETIHGWHEHSADEREQAAPEYPAPIIDHSERREQALELFQRARGDD